MERVRQAVAVLGGIATIFAGLVTIFPDTFTIRGTPPLGSVLGAAFALALPVALACGLVYLLILDSRLKRLARDHKALAAKCARIAALVPGADLGDIAEQVLARGFGTPPARPPSN